MNETKPAATTPEREAARQQLSKLRGALFDLHKTMVDSERVSYEQTVGPIPTPSHFLQLLTHDAWFAWLQPLSQLIVAADVALEEKVPLAAKDVAALEQQAQRLLVASESGEQFSGHYFNVLQRDPDVVMAHAEVMKVVAASRASGKSPPGAAPA